MDKGLSLRLKQETREAGVINGFCYPYAKLLYEKLLHLYAANKIFLGVPKDDDDRWGVTDLCTAIIKSLSQQINSYNYLSAVDSSAFSPNQLKEFLSVCGEFLKIFEED